MQTTNLIDHELKEIKTLIKLYPYLNKTSAIIEIVERLMTTNTAGYFYDDNCRINYSELYNTFYCNDFINGKRSNYDITTVEAIHKINNSLKD